MIGCISNCHILYRVANLCKASFNNVNSFKRLATLSDNLKCILMIKYKPVFYPLLLNTYNASFEF